MSPNGEHVLGNRFRRLRGHRKRGRQFGEYGAIYEFSRTSSGWSTESLEPPASQYARRHFVVASADLSRSLWKLVIQSTRRRRSWSPRSLFVRHSRSRGRAGAVRWRRADGATGGCRTLRRQPRTSVQRSIARSDAPCVLCGFPNRSRTRAVWPGDQTREGDESLYEYVGTGNREPTLVGVSNAGPLQGKTYIRRKRKADKRMRHGAGIGRQRAARIMLSLQTARSCTSLRCMRKAVPAASRPSMNCTRGSTGHRPSPYRSRP